MQNILNCGRKLNPITCLKLLDAGLNNVREPEKEFSCMSEHDFNDWLRDKMENDTVSSEYKFNTSSATRENQVTEPTKTLLLPLSLENNASVSGTASVLEEFGRQFKIPCDHAKLVLQYDEHLKH